MNLKVLGSSSRGNAYILETPTGKLLLECGVKFSAIQEGIGFDVGSVQGCLLTHSHNDHSKASQDVLRAGIELYASRETTVSLGLQHHRMNIIESGKQFSAGDFSVLPFPTEHDAEGSVGYLILYKSTSEKLLFATDTYYLRHRFAGLNYIMVECNYCTDILKANIDAGLLAPGLKNRLLESHFSLENVKEFLKANDMSTVRKIVLLHLSNGNSDKARMIREIREQTDRETVVAEAGKEIELELYPF